MFLDEEFEGKKKESVKPEYLVYKTNPLLMVRDELALMQARFFTAYLCKVDPDNPETFTARFSLSAFCRMLEVDTSNIKKLKEDCRTIRKMGFDFIEYRRKHGEKIDPILMDEISLFSRFAITGNADEGYFVNVTPTEEMKHLLLNQGKYGFVKYEAQNTLVLSTKRNMRMYEFLKRHEGIGVTVDIPTLKAYLGLSLEEYPDTRVFNRDVLKKGIKEINKKTDIWVECEPSKRGNRGKILSFKFTVRKNPIVPVELPPSVKDEKNKPIHLTEEEIADFNSDEASEARASDLPSEDAQDELPGQTTFEAVIKEDEERLAFFRTALKNDKEFTDAQISELRTLALNSQYCSEQPYLSLAERDNGAWQYLRAQDTYSNARVKHPEKRYGYLYGAVRDNWARFGETAVAENTGSSFEGDEFIDAALKRGFDD